MGHTSSRKKDIPQSNNQRHGVIILSFLVLEDSLGYKVRPHSPTHSSQKNSTKHVRKLTQEKKQHKNSIIMKEIVPPPKILQLGPPCFQDQLMLGRTFSPFPISKEQILQYFRNIPIFERNSSDPSVIQKWYFDKHQAQIASINARIITQTTAAQS